MNTEELNKALNFAGSNVGRFVSEYPLVALGMVGGIFLLGYSTGSRRAVANVIKMACQ